MLFKKNEEEWNPWEDETIQECSEAKDNAKDNISKVYKSKLKSKKKIFSNKSTEGDIQELWDNENDVNYLDESINHVYTPDEGIKYSKAKICIFILLVAIAGITSIGFMNTDFDEDNKGYVVSYDLHYERQYVKQSDELLDYCLELKDELSTVMPQLSSNSLTLTNTVQQMKDTLIAKTNKASRYTEIPEMMNTYNDNLISFSLSTQKMLTTMLSNYTNSDYLAWAESAYLDFCNSLNTLEYLRSQINTVIYRNVYGGDS